MGNLALVALLSASGIVVVHLVSLGWLGLRRRSTPALLEGDSGAQVFFLGLAAMMATNCAATRHLPRLEALVEFFLMCSVVSIAGWVVSAWAVRVCPAGFSAPRRRPQIAGTVIAVMAVAIGLGMTG